MSAHNDAVEWTQLIVVAAIYALFQCAWWLKHPKPPKDGGDSEGKL